MVHPWLQLNEAKWLRQNDVSRKIEPSVYQKSTAFHGNFKYGVTGTYSLWELEKLLVNDKIKIPWRPNSFQKLQL